MKPEPTEADPEAERRHQRRPQAFTLLELLIVLSIIMVLIFATGGALSLLRSVSSNARCVGNLKQLAVAVTLYQQENRGMFPSYAENPNDSLNPHGGTAQWDFQIFPYLGYSEIPEADRTAYLRRTPRALHDIFYCPASLRRDVNPDYSRSYFFNVNLAQGNDPSDRRLSTLVAPSRTAMIMELGYPAGSNMSLNIGGGTNNVMYFRSSSSDLLPYFRHSGHINILFADGHAEGTKARPGGSPRWPEGVAFSNSIRW